MGKSKMDEVLERLDAVEGYLGSGEMFGGRVRFSQTFGKHCADMALLESALGARKPEDPLVSPTPRAARILGDLLRDVAVPVLGAERAGKAAMQIASDIKSGGWVHETPIGAERVPGGEVE